MAAKLLLPLVVSFFVLPAARADDYEAKARAFIQKLEGTAGNISPDSNYRDPTRIVSVGLGHRKITDEGMKELAPLTQLRDLHLMNTPVGDAGMKELAPFKHLGYLVLEGTRVTDAGMKDVATRENLYALSLNNTAVADAGLKEVGKLQKLNRLNLSKTAVSDAGMKELSGLKHLEELNLSDTKVTAAGLKALAPVKTIRKLILSPFQMTDDALRVLRTNGHLQYVQGLTGAQVPSLEPKALRLEKYPITDAAIPELADFKGVKFVDVSGTRVSAAGVEAIQKMWPGVRVATSKEK